jgi:hypothetical protein
VMHELQTSINPSSEVERWFWCPFVITYNLKGRFVEFSHDYTRNSMKRVRSLRKNRMFNTY